MKKLSIFFITLGLIIASFASKYTTTNILAAGCDEVCANTAACVSPNAQTTVTCVVQCGGDYCVGVNGRCACTTSTSTSCPPGAWGPWGACNNGFQIRFCSTYGYDSQVQSCSATPPPNTGGGPTAPPILACSVSLTPVTSPVTIGNSVEFTSTVSNLVGGSVDTVRFVSSNVNTASVCGTPPCSGQAGAGDINSPYSRYATGIANGIATITTQVDMGGQTNVCSDTSTLTVGTGATPAPTCTISLSPATSNLTLGGANGTITATVGCSAPVDQVTFSSSNGGVATVTTPGNTVTPNTTYTTTVTGVSSGATIVTGSVYAGGSPLVLDSDTAIVNVTQLGAWFQVEDGDVSTGGDLTTGVQTGQVFELDGAGGFPGIPAYQGTTDLNPTTKVSGTQWLVRNTATSQKIYDYRAITSQIPADTIINNLGSTITNANLNAGNSSYGYTWYRYSGGGGLPLTINGPINIDNKKVILLVDSADLQINGPIRVTDGTGFFMVLVGKTSGGARGNITVDPTVGGGGAPDLEGIYVADNTFSSGTNGTVDTQLWVRGSIVAYGGVSFLRDLVAGNATTPAELIEYAPDQILLYPSKLGVRKLNWKEVAP